MNPELKLFTQSWINLRVPRQAFIDLFVRLIPFLPSKYALPNPRPDNDGFAGSLASVLAGANELPPEVLQVFADIEALAAPEKQPIGDATLEIEPDAPEPCRLRNAIHQWLATGSVGVSPAHRSPGEGGAPCPAGEGGAASEAVVSTGNVAVSPASEPGAPMATAGAGVLLAKSEPAASNGAPSSSGQPATGPLHPSSSVPSAAACKADSETFARLARLAPSEYDRVREKEAHALHLRVRTLDAEVSRTRARLEMEEQTKTVHLQTYEPWPEPVDGAQVLNEILNRFNLHVFMPPGAAVAATLWTGHVPVFEAFHLSPRLNLTSEFGGCGKTTVLDLIAAIVSRALRFESLTPAVLFRIINLLSPVLLLDEVDSYLPQNDELRGLLNAGHKRNSHAYRCEGERYTIRAFKAFAPAVLAGLGELPGTLRDRSIIIHMTPAPAGQQLTRFDPLHLEAETILARKLARWAKDNFAALAACEPPLPPTAFNRLADNWRPLFAVAQVAGGDWPARALDAFNHLTAAAHHRAESLTIKLLRDIQSIFSEAKAERLFSSTIVELLLAIPGRSWLHANKGQTPINQQWLARRLLPLGIAPQTVRIDAGRAKGYLLCNLAEAFAAIPKGNGSA